MITPEDWRERKKEWEAFNRWEAQQPPDERSPEDIVADLGAILSWLPPDVVAEDPDPNKLGIQKLLAVFERLNAIR
jgi:hypothetical protein